MTSSRPDTPLDDFADGAGQRAAEALETAFERAGSRIEQALGRAARSGEADFSRMTEAILADLARLATQQVIERPLAGLIDRALGAITPDGARAEGGPVQPGGAYLVGERGPELFTPGVAGQVSPSGGGVGSQSVHIHLTLPPGSGESSERAIAQSRGRIARSLARAVDEGRRWS
ncbi:phage tail tape measure C-terminal domain-containing protein [Maricaulis sp.]|uniref:phage tail tape measure C-terminal domain-containing protein n=1 Tax=Maricaulis sp. TaxID=1486257 RepID=UPI002B269A5C|nr:phage tail tape measure C-terminal domain-containing protein [Maricaulis sp.]